MFDVFRDHITDILWIVGVALAALAAALFLRRYASRESDTYPDLPAIIRRTQSALITVVVISAIRIALIGVETNDGSWARAIEHILSISLIAAVVWFICEVVIAVEAVLLARISSAHGGDGVRIRKAKTQITMLRRLMVAVVITVGIAAVLMTFPAVRVVGQGLLASAGLISIVAGLAAQSVLGNVIAGIQLALTDSIRVGDVVSAEGQSGTVGEITLTYVVIYLWDDRRLILPSSYFTTTPFENWTRWGSRINGVVLVDVDWSVPLDELRAELDRALAETPLWDGRSASVAVADIANGRVSLRISVSAASTSDMFGLNALVRETVVRFLARQGGAGLPRFRSEGIAGASPPLPDVPNPEAGTG